jgi:hypothetical protein
MTLVNFPEGMLRFLRPEKFLTVNAKAESPSVELTVVLKEL